MLATIENCDMFNIVIGKIYGGEFGDFSGVHENPKEIPGRLKLLYGSMVGFDPRILGFYELVYEGYHQGNFTDI